MKGARELSLNTKQKTDFVDITSLIQREVSGAQVEEGICLVYCPHTTAGVTINERADPSVAQDIQTFLNTLVPEDEHWTHAEGNAPAHVKASMIGSSVQILISQRKLLLGTWQGIFFCEFDGPRQRKIWLRVLS
jgi:secondary thiamine-phosphate synthase enzyme